MQQLQSLASIGQIHHSAITGPQLSLPAMHRTPAQAPVQLRQYQNDLIAGIRQLLPHHAHLVAQAPTGSGKSKIFIAIAQMAATMGTTTLIISESTKIFQQISKEYPAQLINPSSRVSFIAQGSTYIAMAQTLARRSQLIAQFAALGRQLLIINDEAHIGTSTKLLQQIPDAYLIGFTATPAWKWAKHLSELYQGLVVGPQVQELIDAGYLSPYKHFARVAANMDALKVEKGEFTEESQEIAFESDRVYDALAGDLRTLPFRKCVVFTSSISHCRKLYSALTLRGIRCVQVHSGQEESLNSYGMKEFQCMTSGVDVCISVGSLTKGFDFPPIDLVVLMRATTSLPLFLQMVGRGSRLFPGKSLFTCLDYGNNFKRHGLWNEDRDWPTLWLPKKGREKEQVAGVKLCPACEFILPTSKMICTNCGHVFTPARKELAEETQLIDVTNIVRGRKIGSLAATELAEATKSNVIKKSYAIRVAKAREQQGAGYLAEFANAMGYKPQWVTYQEIPTEPIEFFDKTL